MLILPGPSGKPQRTDLTPSKAADGAKAAAKHLYDRLFQWLVAKVNGSMRRTSMTRYAEALKATGPEAREPVFIGILDIFGFEVFEKNSFEQLCINYANERLQQFFTTHVFKLEAATYEAEKISYADIKFEDNQSTVDVIDKVRVGVLPMLHEHCLLPRSSDQVFVTKLHRTHGKKSAAYSVPKERALRATCFVVHHSAASVTYDATGFPEKNKDRLNALLERVFASSSLTACSQMMKGASAAASSLTGSGNYLGAKFKDNMDALMRVLQGTNPHFVRCLKPNRLKRPRYVEPALVHHQLRYLGVLDSIRIRHSGFSFRTPYSDFYERFILIGQGKKVGPRQWFWQHNTH